LEAFLRGLEELIYHRPLLLAGKAPEIGTE
jgi:hypothetical protein